MTPAATPGAAPTSPGDSRGPGGSSGSTTSGSAPAPRTGGGTSGSTGGGLSSGGTLGGVPGATPSVVYQARAGDTLGSLWQSCYTAAFPDILVFAQVAAALNERGLDLNNLRAGDQVTLPGGWSGAGCPLTGSPTAPAGPPPRLNPGVLPRPF